MQNRVSRDAESRVYEERALTSRPHAVHADVSHVPSGSLLSSEKRENLSLQPSNRQYNPEILKCMRYTPFCSREIYNSGRTGSFKYITTSEKISLTLSSNKITADNLRIPIEIVGDVENISRPLDPLNYAHAESRNRNIRIESIAQFTDFCTRCTRQINESAQSTPLAGQGRTTHYTRSVYSQIYDVSWQSESLRRPRCSISAPSSICAYFFFIVTPPFSFTGLPLFLRTKE